MRYLTYIMGFVMAFTVACGESGEKKASAPEKATVAEEPKMAAPKMEAPKMEAPKVEAPKMDAPKAAMSSKPAGALNGEALFNDKGCAACHFADTGTERVPYPSKQLLAALPLAEFSKISINGRPGTMMAAQELTKEESKAIFEWIKKFKK